jgi:SagB-type dehydrogenase family enzyme
MKHKRYVNQDAGFKSIVPEGWTEDRPGEFKRGASEDDPTALIQVAIPGLTVDALVEMLLPQLGFEALPEPVDRLEVKRLSWSLYVLERQGPGADEGKGSLALAQGDTAACFVLLVASGDEHDDLYQTAFLPAVQALALLAPDPEIEAHVDEYHAIVRANRDALRNGPWPDFPTQSDQRRGLPMPPAQQPYNADAPTIDLPVPDPSILSKASLYECIADRASQRRYTDESLTLDELAYLLWATQGVRKVVLGGKGSLRTVPSSGGRHPFETDLAINHVDGIDPGIYRYLPFEHKLLLLLNVEGLPDRLTELSMDQRFVGVSAVCFIWSAVPYRQEWRYGTQGAKGVLLDAGHVCQNLYLACESIGCGTCAIAAYDQAAFDRFLGLDGEEELVVYLAPVGKVASGS